VKHSRAGIAVHLGDTPSEIAFVEEMNLVSHSSLVHLKCHLYPILAVEL
jgi:hypothetical protein